MPKKKKPVTITMKLDRNGTMTMRSTGGFDLRKLFPPKNEDASDNQVELAETVVTTMLKHKAEMIGSGERYKIAVCPLCGGSLLLALIGPKNHARMFCRGTGAENEPQDRPPCAMHGME